MTIDVIRLAREAGIEWQQHTGVIGRITVTTCGSQSLERLERFAALATADLKAANAELLEALRQLLHDDSEQYAWEVWEKHGGAA